MKIEHGSGEYEQVGSTGISMETTPESRSLGRLWRRIADPPEKGGEVHTFIEPAPFDTAPLAKILEERRTLGDPQGLFYVDYLDAMNKIESWEGAGSPGVSQGDPQHSIWVLLHGRRDPHRPGESLFFGRPSLLVVVAGYSSWTDSCDSVALSVSPLLYKPESKEWRADEDQAVLATGRLAERWFVPPSQLEMRHLGELADSIHDLLPKREPEPKGGGMYRSFHSNR